MLSNLSTKWSSSWKDDMTLKCNDFLNLDDLSSIAGARCARAGGAAERVPKDHRM